MTKKQGRSVVDYERIYQNLTINDATDPHSLVNIAPSVVADRIKTIPEEMFDLSEEELLKKKVVDETEERLRVTFWQEYTRAIRCEEKMNAKNIYNGVTTMTEFRKICDHSAKLLYIIRPIASFYTEAEYLLNIGFRNAMKVMKLDPVSPVVDREGNLISKIDYKLAALQAKYFQYIVEITRPEEPKELHIKGQHLHAALPGSQIPPQDMAAIDAQLAQLEHNPAPSLKQQTPFQEVVYETVQIEESSDQ